MNMMKDVEEWTLVQLGCLVEASREKQDKEVDTASCSGILLSADEGLVLTHASLFLSCLSNTDCATLSQSSTLSAQLLQDLKIKVTLERPDFDVRLKSDSQHLPEKLLDLPKYDKYYTKLLGSSNSGKNAPKDTWQVDATIERIWKSSKFAKTLQTILPHNDGWSFFEANDTKDVSQELQDRINFLIPCFVLLKLQGTNVRCDSELYHGQLTKGQNIWSMGSPFGNLCPEVFLNCVSQGIISNLAGSEDEVILTDARCIPGTEGGAIYVNSDSRKAIAGIIVAPLCWKANEWVGLTIACSLTEILSSLHVATTRTHSVTISSWFVNTRVSATNDTTCMRNQTSNPKVTQFPTVCLVQCGGSWGSGVLVDKKGVLLTCAHVVKFSKNSCVKVIFPESHRYYEAEVVTCSSPREVFDMAILRVKTSEPLQIHISAVTVAAPVQGVKVLAVGHGCFGVDKGLGPTFSQGHIAKVVKVNKSPILIQSTCAVHAGVSGGPLLSPSGSLLGIVACNARDTETGASYPHVNMSVPLVAVWHHIQAYLNSGDKSHLKFLTIKDSKATDLWALRNSVSTSKL